MGLCCLKLLREALRASCWSRKMQVEAFIKLYRPKLPLEGLAVK